MKRKIDDKFPIFDKEKEKKKDSEDNKPVLSNGNHKDEDVEMNGIKEHGVNGVKNGGVVNGDVNMKENDGDEKKEDEKEKVKKRIFTEQTVDLLKRLLIYDPKKRISAENALKHDFFEKELPEMTKQEDMPQFEEHHVKHTRREKRPDDVGELNKTNDNEEAASC